MKVALELPESEMKTLREMTKAESYGEAVKLAVETYLRKNGFSLPAPKEIFENVNAVVKETVEEFLRKKEFGGNSEELEKKVQALINQAFGRMKGGVSKALSPLKTRLDEMEEELSKLNGRLNKLESIQHSHEKAIGILSNRLEELSSKVSTGNRKEKEGEEIDGCLNPCMDTDVYEWVEKINSVFFADTPFKLKIAGSFGGRCVVKVEAEASGSLPIEVSVNGQFLAGLMQLASNGKATVVSSGVRSSYFFVKRIDGSQPPSQREVHLRGEEREEK